MIGSGSDGAQLPPPTTRPVGRLCCPPRASSNYTSTRRVYSSEPPVRLAKNRNVGCSRPTQNVGLVASRKRSASTLGYLRDRGVSEADLSRVQAPAGLDLGATDHREIAVAILAELVARRARGELRSPVTAVVPAPTLSELATDPVCGMTVEIAISRWHADYDGRRLHFCSPGCMQTFTSNPEVFAGNGPRSS